MTYPPGNPGYPPAPQGNQYAPTQQYGKVGDGPEAAGPSKLPVYLTAAVAALGLATYAFNFGPMLTISNSDFPQFGSASGSTPGLGLAVAASVLAALLAIVGLLPKQKPATGLVAVVSTLSFLLVLAEVINAPAGLSIGWGLYLIIATTVLQAGTAIAALLFDAGVLTAPAPKPRYEQPYGQQYGAPSYYGQMGGQPGQQYGAPTHQQHQPQQQRPATRPSTAATRAVRAPADSSPRARVGTARRAARAAPRTTVLTRATMARRPRPPASRRSVSRPVPRRVPGRPPPGFRASRRRRRHRPSPRHSPALPRRSLGVAHPDVGCVDPREERPSQWWTTGQSAAVRPETCSGSRSGRRLSRWA